MVVGWAVAGPHGAVRVRDLEGPPVDGQRQARPAGAARTGLRRPAGAGLAPNARMEEILLCIAFAEVLGLDTVGVDDGFFELGGPRCWRSAWSARIRAVLGIETRLRTLSRPPPSPNWRSRLTGAASGQPALRARQARPARIPLSDGQRRLWILAQLEGPSATYNLPGHRPGCPKTWTTIAIGAAFRDVIGATRGRCGPCSRSGGRQAVPADPRNRGWGGGGLEVDRCRAGEPEYPARCGAADGVRVRSGR